MVPIKQKRAQNLLDGSMLTFGLAICLRVKRCAVVRFAAQKSPQTPPKVSHEPRITISDKCVWYTENGVQHVSGKGARCAQMSLANETQDQYRVLCKAQPCITGVYWAVAAHYSTLPGHLAPLCYIMSSPQVAVAA